MTRLNSPNCKQFSLKNFEKYPVWTWDDAMEGHLPIADQYPSWEEYGSYLIKAQFYKDKYIFNGYLIGCRSFYAFCLFVANHEILFNLNLVGFLRKSEKK